MKFTSCLLTVLSFLTSCSNTDSKEQIKTKEVEIEGPRTQVSDNILNDRDLSDSSAFDPFLIDEHGVGTILLQGDCSSIKLPDDSFYLDSIDVYLGEGLNGINYRLLSHENQAPLLMLQPTLSKGSCWLSSIYVLSDRFKTNRDVSVGTTLARLDDTYTIMDIVGNEFGSVYVFVRELKNVGFEFVGVKDVVPGKLFDKTIFNGSEQISKIYLYADL